MAYEAVMSNVQLAIELNAAKAMHLQAAYDLEYARTHGFSTRYIREAEHRLDAAVDEMLAALAVHEAHTPEVLVWSSGFLLDEHCAEYQYHIEYLPLEYRFQIVRADEGEIRKLGTVQTLPEAHAFVNKVRQEER